MVAPRPSILDEVFKQIEQPARQEQLTKAKKDLEASFLEQLGNVRLQEDLVAKKEKAFEELSEGVSEREDNLRRESLENARLILEDRYQGAEVLALELQRVNKALQEMKDAGLAPFGNRAARRSQKSE